jgi:hypothetical protein
MGEDTSRKTAIGFDGPPEETENENDDEDETSELVRQQVL